MATLSATIIAMDVIAAFKKRFPMLFAFGTDFSAANANLNQQITARIATLPTVQDYDASDGYEANAANANDLMLDVPVTIDRHKHVPVKIDYIDQISTNRNLYQETMGNLAYVLGKEAVDYALGLAKIANFSEYTTETINNTDRDTLGKVRKAGNSRGMLPLGRVGIVNSDFYEALEIDTRIASKDYYGQETGGEAYGHLRNVAGFQHVWEYPDLPANSENLSGFFFDRRAFAIASRLPNKGFDLAASFGVPRIANVEVVQDPESGLALLAISWQKQGTFDTYVTLAWMYGVTAGSQGAAAVATSGTLTEGETYRIETFESGDDFTNVGAASNATGVEFVATGTTPTTWSNSSEVVQLSAKTNFAGHRVITS